MAEYLPATVNSLFYYELPGVFKENFKEGKIKKSLVNIEFSY
jgi:hypothetical protein